MNRVVIFLRSLAFSASFLFFMMFIIFPLVIITLPLPSILTKKVALFWAIGSAWLLKTTTGITYKIEGKENIINDETCIYVSKHQSTFETWILYMYLNMPVFIAKKELLYIPIFGWGMKKVGFITINRSKGREASAHLAKAVKNLEKTHRSIVIFVEGTRTPFGIVSKYKSGAYNIWENTGKELKVIPVALNTGKYWKKRQFMKKPGQMIISFLPAISFNKDTIKSEFMDTIQEKIETRQRKFK